MKKRENDFNLLMSAMDNIDCNADLNSSTNQRT